MARKFITVADLTCVQETTSRLSAPQSTVMISAPVGTYPPRCKNLPADVRQIQQTLNGFTPLEGGPPEQLKVDGICGKKTGSAIYHFQAKWGIYPKGMKIPDGIVDPDGPTIQRLRAGSGRVVDLPSEFATRIPRVMQIVASARRSLHFARLYLEHPAPTGTIPSLSKLGEADANRVERHFHLMKSPNPINLLHQIDGIFLNMQTTLGYIPQGVIVAQDEPENHTDGRRMFSFEGGYHYRSNRDTQDGLHLGSIYLCPLARTLLPEAFAYVMIHELAHYTGPTEQGIIDHAYYHREPDNYRNLSHYLAFHNADSYSQFAFDAIGKPNYNALSDTYGHP